MDLQTTSRIPAGSLTSELSCSIVDRLRAHGPLTLDALRHCLPPKPQVTAATLAKRLEKLQRAGHVERAPVQAGNPVRWQIATVAQPSTPAPEPELVPPRRVDVMSGEYKPAPMVLRAGALDYRKHPSVFLGERRPYQRRDDPES